MEALLMQLDHAAVASQALPFWVLVAGHSLTAVEVVRGITPFWLTSWLMGLVAAYGGGTLSALLLRSPGTAAIGLFAKNQLGIVYTMVWWAVLYCPGGGVAKAYERMPPVRAGAKLCRAMLRANTVVQRVNASVKLYPGVVAAPLIIGTLSGCGGKLLLEAWLHCAGYARGGPTELSHPGYAMRSAAVGAVLQYLLVHVLGLLSSQQGLGLVASIYVAHSLATDITGTPCDYTAPLGRLFHKLTLIPEPPLPAGAKAPAAAPTAKPRQPSRSRSRARSAAGSPARVPRGRRARRVESDAEEEAEVPATAAVEQVNGSQAALEVAAAALMNAAARRTTRRRVAAGAIGGK